MAPTFFKGILLGCVVAVTVSAATAAVAGTGVGAVFNLGRTNSVNATSRLSGSASGAMLKVANSGSGPALRLEVGKGRPPLTVNSAVKVANLNAGLLGGLGPAGYVQGGGLNRAFALTLTDQTGKLLSIPGYGTVMADCIPGGVPFASLDYVNGPHAVDFWVKRDVVLVSAVPASGSAEVLSVGGQNVPAWAQVMIDYATAAGHAHAQHVAILTAAANFDGSACKFVAQVDAGPGRQGP